MHKGELEEGEHQALRRKVEEVEFTKGEVASKEALAFGGSLEIDQDPGFSNLMGGSAAVVPVVAVVVVDEAFTVAVRVNPEERGVAERPARVVEVVQLGVPSRVLLLLQPTGTAPRRTVYWKKVVARVTVAEVMRRRELLGDPASSEDRMSTPPAHPAAVQSSRG